MTLRRERVKPTRAQSKEMTDRKPTKVSNLRKEKVADFLIDVAKYVFTGVLITSLFNDVTNKTVLYIVGIGVVIVSIWGGLK